MAKVIDITKKLKQEIEITPDEAIALAVFTSQTLSKTLAFIADELFKLNTNMQGRQVAANAQKNAAQLMRIRVIVDAMEDEDMAKKVIRTLENPKVADIIVQELQDLTLALKRYHKLA